jgi:DNA invertase Pin-like site-specific DNA recombinase
MPSIPLLKPVTDRSSTDIDWSACRAAEFERDLISERTKAGLEAARVRGRKGGRPPIMTPQKVRMARQMYDARERTVEEIAKTVGVSRKTIYRYLRH